MWTNISMQLRTFRSMNPKIYLCGFSLVLTSVVPCSAGAFWDTEGFKVPSNTVFPQAKAQIKTAPFREAWSSSLALRGQGYLLLGIGGMGLCQTLEINASGKCTFVYMWEDGTQQAAVWKKYSFSISQQMLDELARALQEKGCGHLLKSYSNENIQDGCIAVLSWSDGKVKKSVWMNNYFPDEFRAIMAWTEQKIIEPQRPNLSHGNTVSYKAATEYDAKAFGSSIRDYLNKN